MEFIEERKTIGNDLFIKFKNIVFNFSMCELLRNEDEIFINYDCSVVTNRKNYSLNFYNETNKKIFTKKNKNIRYVLPNSQPIWDDQCRCFDGKLNIYNIYEHKSQLNKIVKPYISYCYKIIDVEKNIAIEENLLKCHINYYICDDMICFWKNNPYKLYFKKIN